MGHRYRGAAHLRRLASGTRSLMVAALLISLTACGTQAQRQLSQINAALEQATIDYRSCVAPIRENPVNQPVLAKIPVFTHATMIQIMDEGYASPSEGAILSSIISAREQCRQAANAILAPHRGNLVAIRQAEDHTLTEIAIGVVRRQVSWGMASSRIQKLDSWVDARISEDDKTVYNRLLSSHNSEVYNRANSMALIQNAIAQSRTTQTDCYSFANSTRCTSY